MSQINAHPERIRSAAKELESLRRQHLAQMRQMRILVNNLSDIWKGDAQDALAARFYRESRAMGELSTMLEEYIHVLDDAADKMDHVDLQLKTKIRKI